jgi:hypothetical protein
MQFTRIEDPSLYGYQAISGRYKVEIIRVCASHWQIFYAIGVHPYMPTYGVSHTFKYPTAKRIATEWLKQKEARHAAGS